MTYVVLGIGATVALYVAAWRMHRKLIRAAAQRALWLNRVQQQGIEVARRELRGRAS